jgi:hypothetical protein
MKSTAQNVTWLPRSNFSIVHHSEERMFAGLPEPEDVILKPYSPSIRSLFAVSDSSSDEEQVIIFLKKFSFMD